MGSGGDIEVVRTDWSDPAFHELVTELDAFFSVLDGPDSAHFQALSQTETMSSVVVARLNGRPVGCGALREHEPGVAEIKRMYVRPTARGRGVGGRILAELESWAAEGGYERLVLETAKELAPARALYESNGFVRIPNYGEYVSISRSVCYGKRVQTTA